MRNFIFLFALALALAGCSSDDTADVPPGLLTKVVVQPFAGSGYATRYYYNGYKLDRAETTTGEKEIYYYAGDLIVNIKLYNHTALTSEKQLFYNDDEQLVKVRAISHNHDSVTTTVYQHNADGTVTQSDYAGDAASQDLHTTSTLHYESGLVARIDRVDVSLPDVVNTTTYLFDDKPSPTSNVKGFSKMSLAQDGVVMRNVVWVEFSNNSDPVAGNYNVVYQYNANGFPVSSAIGGQGTTTPDAGSLRYYYK